MCYVLCIQLVALYSERSFNRNCKVKQDRGPEDRVRLCAFWALKYPCHYVNAYDIDADDYRCIKVL